MKAVVTTFAVLAVLVSASVFAQQSPYAGQQTRGIKALSETEVADLLAGNGMGYAKAAELNGYPGPAHVLELAQQLSLAADQRNRTRMIFDAMQAKAKKIGAQLVEEERNLDKLFAERQASAATIPMVLTRIGRLQTELRLVHLEAHIAQRDILTDAQIANYQQLRGYASAGGRSSGHTGHKH
jgi:Spy/CpxP family protein refolding chaperone